MTAEVLIARCREVGITLAPGPEGKLRVSPPGKLPEALREELKRHKAEVLALLEAVSLLRARLAPDPQRIAPLIAEWLGTLGNPTGRDLDTLMQARWVLRVEAYVGEDNRLWWRLPQTAVR